MLSVRLGGLELNRLPLPVGYRGEQKNKQTGAKLRRANHRAAGKPALSALSGSTNGTPATSGDWSQDEAERRKQSVSEALRLGWQLAEVRGRCRVQVPPVEAAPSLASRQLPLTAAEERTACSSTIEATLVLVSVAKSRGVDFDVARLVNPTPVEEQMRLAMRPARAGKGDPGKEDTDKASLGVDRHEVAPGPEAKIGGQRGGAGEGSRYSTVTWLLPSGRRWGIVHSCRPAARFAAEEARASADAPPWDATDLLRYLVCVVLLQREDDAALPGQAADDHNAAERRVRITAALGVDLAVALWAADLTSGGALDAAAPPAEAQTLADAIGDLMTCPPDPSSPDTPPGWKLVQTMLFRWDQAIQDALGQGAFGDSSAYQLGRGLAESYWSLDLSGGPTEETAPVAGSWQFLLGTPRAATFTTLCDRLSGPIDARTTDAIKFSIQTWRDWVKEAFGPAVVSPERQRSASVDLYNQIGIWRDLLLTGRDPTTYVDPSNLLNALASPRLLLRSFRAELVTGMAGAAALVLAIPNFSGSAAKVITALGAVGVTSSALGASAKKNAQQVGTQLKAAVNQQAINQAVLRPQPPAKSQIAALFTAVRRGLTSTWRSWTSTKSAAPPDSPFFRDDNVDSPMAGVLPLLIVPIEEA